MCDMVQTIDPLLIAAPRRSRGGHALSHISLCGQDLFRPRYTMYPGQFNRFWEYPTVTFQLWDDGTRDCPRSALAARMEASLRQTAPLYRLLVTASEYEGTDYLQRPIHDPWNPENP